MRIEVDDKYYKIIVDGMDCLIKNYDTYGYRMEDVILMVTVGTMFNEKVKQAIREMDDEEVKYAKEHPEFTQPPKPGQHFVMGKGYVDDKKK